jgi:hypothetical protein
MESQTVAVKERLSELDERKAQLIRQGEFYRVGVVHAKVQLQYAARPEALFHSAIEHAGFAVRARLDSLLAPSGSNVASLMPYAMVLIRFVRHRKLGKASLGVALALTGIGWYLQQRRAEQDRQ